MIDSFVHDYTWDDETLVWQFHHGFPEGFAPLYPLNSLMLHGIEINRGGRVKGFEPADMIDEIRSFFGTGTNCQELYITPDLLTDAIWDVLAEAGRATTLTCWSIPIGSEATRPRAKSTAGRHGQNARAC